MTIRQVEDSGDYSRRMLFMTHLLSTQVYSKKSFSVIMEMKKVQPFEYSTKVRTNGFIIEKGSTVFDWLK